MGKENGMFRWETEAHRNFVQHRSMFNVVGKTRESSER